MSNLKQCMGIIVSSTNAPHDTFRRSTRRPASFNFCLSKHALEFALIWAISATSIAFAGEVTTSTNDTEAVEVVEPETAIPLKLSKPLMSPSGAAPSTEPVQINFGASIVGGVKPSAVVIERVTSSGDKTLEETELHDDGKKPDEKAGDGFYSGTLELGSQEEETEIYFRLRSEYRDSEYHEKTVTSDIALFPITKLPLGSSPSTGHLIYSAKDQVEFFAGEVVVEPRSGVSPRRFQEIVKDINDKSYKSDKSGADLRPFTLTIKGYIPPLNTYLVEFGMSEGDKTLPHQAIKRLIQWFKYSELRWDAWANYKSTPAASNQWYLRRRPGINAENLEANFPNPGKGVGVAIIDRNIDCRGIGASCRTVTPRNDSCDKYSYNINSSTSSDNHGTNVAKLTAGAYNNATDFAGVAHKIALYPIQLCPKKKDGSESDCTDTTGFTLSQAITCAGNISARFGARINILTIAHTVADGDTLRGAVCSAVCADQLIVASAGNAHGNCNKEGFFPARYTRDKWNKTKYRCLCDRAMRRGVLSVGGTDKTGNLATGNRYNFNKCSFSGVVHAPGWHIPGGGNPEREYNFASSWSTALVSGCAAVRAAVQIEKYGWNPSRLKKQLIKHSGGQSRLLNCNSAVADPNRDPVYIPGSDPDEPIHQ